MTDGGFELYQARALELQLDLSRAKEALNREQKNNSDLKALQTESTNAYKVLKEKFDRHLVEHRREKDLRRQEAEDHQRQLAQWRAQVDARARELQDLQARLAMEVEEPNFQRMQLIEEIEEPYVQKVRALESQLLAEQRRSADARHEAQLRKAEAAHREEEQRDELAEAKRRHELRERDLEKQIAALEVHQRQQAELEAAMAQVKRQLHDAEARATCLTVTLREQEQQSERERSIVANDLKARVEEVSDARRRCHDLQVRVDKEERRAQTLLAEKEATHREQMKAAARFEQAEAQLRAAALQPATSSGEFQRLQEDFAQQRAGLVAERDQLAQTAKAADEQRQTSQLALRRAESRARQLEEDHAQRDRELLQTHEEAQAHLRAEIADLQSKIDIAEKELEVSRSTWYKRESALLQQVENSSRETEGLRDDIADIQAAAESRQREVREAAAKANAAAQQHQAELGPLREKVQRLEQEQERLSTDLAAARELLRKKEQHNELLHAEVTSLNQRLESDRKSLAREADEAFASTLREEEKRRNSAMQQQAEEHKRQLAKVQYVSKRALAKAAKKRQEYRQRCQDLLKRVEQLKLEKATAIRVCEENKTMFELRLADLACGNLPLVATAAERAALPASLADSVAGSMVLRTSASSTAGGGGLAGRRELQAIAERLEVHAERLRTQPAAGDNPA